MSYRPLAVHCVTSVKGARDAIRYLAPSALDSGLTTGAAQTTRGSRSSKKFAPVRSRLFDGKIGVYTPKCQAPRVGKPACEPQQVEGTTMTRFETTTRHTLTLASMVLTTTLAVPAVTQAQSITGEQMLLNRVGPTAGRYQRFVVPLAEAASGESANRIDGATAMGGNKAGTSIQQQATGNDAVAGPETWISGEQALLGRVSPVKSRDVSLAASFNAAVAGAVSGAASGDAEFGVVPGDPGSAPAVTVSLGARGSGGAVVFTLIGGGELKPGVYNISEEGNLRALVVTGTPNRPTGVFRVKAGTLTISQASGRSLQGKFRLDAEGFLASAPDNENQRVSVSGEFTAAPAVI
jgi:hypothetical protein